MKARFLLVIIFFLFVFCLASCQKKEFELYKDDGEEFLLDKSINTLEKNGWEKIKNEYSMAQETEFLMNYCHYFDDTFEIEEIKDYIYLIGPERIQTKKDFSYSVSFIVFSSSKDAEKYLDFQKNRNENKEIKISIDKNIVVTTNSDEVVLLVPLQFIII